MGGCRNAPIRVYTDPPGRSSNGDIHTPSITISTGLVQGQKRGSREQMEKDRLGYSHRFWSRLVTQRYRDASLAKLEFKDLKDAAHAFAWIRVEVLVAPWIGDGLQGLDRQPSPTGGISHIVHEFNRAFGKILFSEHEFNSADNRDEGSRDIVREPGDEELDIRAPKTVRLLKRSAIRVNPKQVGVFGIGLTGRADGK